MIVIIIVPRDGLLHAFVWKLKNVPASKLDGAGMLFEMYAWLDSTGTR